MNWFQIHANWSIDLSNCLAYQTEIDSLTKRSKTSDNAFLHVYKVLAEVPDPYPLLEAAVVRPVSIDLNYDLTTCFDIGPSGEGHRGNGTRG